MKKKTTDLQSLLKHASRDELSEMIESIECPEFVSELEKMICTKQTTKGEVIRNTLLERTYAYQIMQGRKQGSKDKIIQICLALKCSIEETNRFLTLTHNPSLYAKDKRDMLIIFAVENQMSVMDTNELLSSHYTNVLE